MRFNPVPLMAVVLLLLFTSHIEVNGQNPGDERYRLSLKSGSFIPPNNIVDEQVKLINQVGKRPGGKSFFIIQFESIPGDNDKKQLQQSGIELLDYVPNNAYSATVNGSLNADVLKKVKTRAIVALNPDQKMQPELALGIFPPSSIRLAGIVDVWVSFPRSFTYETVSSELQLSRFEIVATNLRAFHIVGVRVPVNRLRELAALPFIEFVQAAPKEDQPLNNKSRANTRANVLNSSLLGGRNLTGEGIVVGVGDDSDPTRHIDFTGRVINRAPSIGGSHGLHVMGTIGSAGIRQELYTGYAPKSTLVVQRFSGILEYAPLYVQDHGMVITNNSYGNVTECSGLGVYDLISRIVDQQAFMMPNLQHVFAVGNSGDSACGPYLAGFSNVLAGYQTSKNSITVGNTDVNLQLFSNSSRGPVRDGRIKPEVVAQGMQVYSTIPTNGYGASSGTSMSAPAVSGGLALLYQRYKQLHAGNNPGNGLMKALICNGATDLGNTGPDFSYGFGFLNLLRSVKMLENNSYFTPSVNAGATNNHNISIAPGANIARLKVMLYWNDSAAAAFAANALVTDLDLTVTDPSAITHLPQLLNTTPANVNAPATTGADHVNNIEQVVIENPLPGNYTFSVTGTTIPFGGQHGYYLVFDTIPVSTVLTYPLGGERLQQGDAVYLQWDSYGNPANDFTLQYSIDNGSNWIDVVNGVNVTASLRQLAWTVPAVTSEQVKVRLTHNGTGIQSESGSFIIAGVPVITLASVANQCEGYINMSWTAVAGATNYEVMLLRGDEMTPVGTTTATSFAIGGLSRDTTYWATVRARVNGSPGRRANAVSRQPVNGNCTGTISDKDLKVDLILSPVSSGRKFTSTELANSVPITIRIENLDNAPTTGDIPVTYILDNNPPVTETIVAPNIGSRLSYNYTFTAPVNLSAVGTYQLKVSVSYPGDPYVQNDTITAIFKQLDNPFINLATDFIDDIESAVPKAYTGRQVGLSGLDRYDFNTTSAFGQVRTFINTGIAYSGSKALTIDSDRYNVAGTSDSLTGTFNLLGYSTATDNIRLDFMYKHHGQLSSHPANKVWIRGDDQKPWIEVYDLYANQEDAGVFRRSASIEINNILATAIPAQAFSSSFQVRWGQWGQLNATDNENGAGYTFDDIRLYRVTNDLEMVEIDTPVTVSCGLNNIVPVQVTVRNTVGNIINAVPVKMQVDGGTIITEVIPTIAANSSIAYMFTATADLSLPGYHTLKVWVDLAGDSFADNDTTQIVLYNAPLVTSFPYLQDFELDEGGWHTEGRKISWQYGTPIAPRINGAASGTKAWKTNLGGQYNNLEQSYLISPCFDVTPLANPMLSFSVALDLEDCGATLCDAAYIEYSGDGNTWTRLGTNGTGTNWYNRNYSGNEVWSIQNYTRWHVASIPLPTGFDRLRLRFVMSSDPALTREGIAIDDIHIYDSIYNIYDGPPYTSAVVSQPGLAGTGWIDFISGGEIIASVNPNGQNMGNTDAQAFIHTAATRINNLQYYHNRNITLKPSVVNLADSATVRFYFLDSEAEALINATGCGVCSKPRSAYELGVTKYSSTNDALENGDLTDNIGGIFSFTTSANVKKVPFDKGYYAEFKVKDFSEFWLNNGGPSNDQALPVELSGFNARKNERNEVIVSWVTATENNSNHFDVELARGNDDFRQNHFIKIGSVNSHGNSTSEQRYTFVDVEANKNGVRYYRLKIVDINGSFTYSEVRSVVFNNEITWQVYPNPSSGLFEVVMQAGDGTDVIIKVHDVNGRLVKETKSKANAFVQKIMVDLDGAKYSSGMYLLEVSAGERKQVFRVIKK